MPPTNSARSLPRLVIPWVEDGIAQVYAIDLATDAVDEIARFNVDGIPQIVAMDFLANFVRIREGLPRPRPPVVTNGTPAPVELAPAPAPYGYKRDGTPRKIPAPGMGTSRKNAARREAGRYPSGARVRSREDIDEAHARSERVLAYIAANPGRTSDEIVTALSVDMGGKASGGLFGQFVRWKRARVVDGKWYVNSPNANGVDRE
jgi:hypothetical protein